MRTGIRWLLAMKAANGGAKTKKYGGIVCWTDNTVLSEGNGKLTDVTTNNDFFLAAVIDTGDASSKAYTITRFGSEVVAPIRFYNDLEGTSIDYWSIWRDDISPHNPSEYSFTSAGRYIVVPVLKEDAADFYLRYKDGDYLIKGSDVT